MLFVGTEKFFPEILEEHLEVLGELWRRRPDFVRSSEDSVRRLGYFDERIEAHTDGLVVAGNDASELLHTALNGDEPELVTAAVFALLKTDDETAAHEVWDTFQEADGPMLDAYRQALLHAPLDMLKKNLEELALKTNSLHSAIALESLAFQSLIEPQGKQLLGLLDQDDPTLRWMGWRIASLCDTAIPSLETGWQDNDATVRREALMTAAWRQHQPLLDHCRNQAGSPSIDQLNELVMLATLGEPDDLELLLSLGQNQDLGAARYDILAAFGHPAGVDLLLEAIADPNAAIATAAGRAYMTITGVDIESDNRVPLMPEDGSEPDEFDKEFLDEVTLPNPELAVAHWDQSKEQFANSPRWRRGFDVSAETTQEALELLDLESRYACRIRSRFTGQWDGRPQDLDKLIPNEPMC